MNDQILDLELITELFVNFIFCQRVMDSSNILNFSNHFRWQN